ncbi:hypothetical protein CANMA_001221 [Candida margitis]|uniref:uncharacterized protein n=1 Tax=Candida margitis TaxID=1775924 RepID=UPI0022279EE4|nr:uncharacterized protein CANMA_001221 [Candida margitis]KAI5969759.1 hypothetical protein CANMA_001221 [Candida margitis]
MSPPSSIYIVPPYLLSTHEGSQLRKKLARISERLSLSNVITTDSPDYFKVTEEVEQESEEDNFTFSDNPVLHSIIKEKVLYKLAIIGVLGNNPMELSTHDDKYVHELFSIFKSRLLEGGDEDDGAKNADNTERENTSTSSVFASNKVGEVDFKNLHNENTSDEYQAYYPLTLKELLKLANSHPKSRSGHLPSLIALDKETYFGYPLPLSWSPLIHSKYLSFLKTQWDFGINNDNGYSTISMKGSNTSIIPEDGEDLNKARFYNLITDQPVNSSFGIFYYELEVEQVAAQSTNFRTLISMNDPAVSSNSTLEVLAGFTKRFVTYDAMKSPSNSTKQQCTIDMEKIKHDINHNESSEGFSSADLNLFLNTKPGEFKGSYAVNFADSNFYNSIKGAESLGRSQVPNLNRRLSTIGRTHQQDLDSGKIDIGIPFKTRMVEDTPARRVYKTDVVGLGVNFTNKTVFITLNGVLAKVICEKDIVSNHGASNDLFGAPSSGNPSIEIYPMFGFKMNELERIGNVKEFSSAKITTNLGFKEFKFNIRSYVNHFKRENQEAIYLSLLEKIRSSHSKSSDSNTLSDTERSLLHVNEDPEMLNKLIKGYLVHQGYIKTFNALNTDLTNLGSSTENGSGEEENAHILTSSHACNRQRVKSLMQAHQFDEVLHFLEENYHHEFFESISGVDTVFNIKWLDYMISLKKYLDRRLKLHDNFEFEFRESEQEMLDKIIAKRDALLQQYRLDPKQDKVNELSPLLLVRSKEDLDKLPKAKKLLENHALHFNKILTSINGVILSSAGFKKTSNLEKIFNQVENNVTSLIEHDQDNNFKLLNLEADYMGQYI